MSRTLYFCETCNIFMLSQRCILGHQTKPIGTIKFNTFITWRHEQHIMRQFNAFGISKNLLDFLDQMGIKLVKIIYLSGEQRKVYTEDIKSFLNSEKEYNYQGDEQKFVSIDEMRLVIKC